MANLIKPLRVVITRIAYNYKSRPVNYNRRGFIRLDTGLPPTGIDKLYFVEKCTNKISPNSRMRDFSMISLESFVHDDLYGSICA